MAAVSLSDFIGYVQSQADPAFLFADAGDEKGIEDEGLILGLDPLPLIGDSQARKDDSAARLGIKTRPG